MPGFVSVFLDASCFQILQPLRGNHFGPDQGLLRGQGSVEWLHVQGLLRPSRISPGWLGERGQTRAPLSQWWKELGRHGSLNVSHCQRLGTKSSIINRFTVLLSCVDPWAQGTCARLVGLIWWHTQSCLSAPGLPVCYRFIATLSLVFLACGASAPTFIFDVNQIKNKVSRSTGSRVSPTWLKNF